MNYRYTVKAIFKDRAVAEEWRQWLQNRHCEEVLQSGATHVEILALDSEDKVIEVRYIFENRQAFNAYEEKHAARLREKGLALFPTSRGITYERSTGTVVFKA